MIYLCIKFSNTECNHMVRCCATFKNKKKGGGLPCRRKIIKKVLQVYQNVGIKNENDAHDERHLVFYAVSEVGTFVTSSWSIL
jgi:hypothetical protein